MKKLLILLIALFASVFTAYSADFYTVYDFAYSVQTPSNVFVDGGECSNSQCSSLAGDMQLYDRGALSCWTDRTTQEAFNTCMAGYALSGNIATSSGVIVRQEIPSTFGYVAEFFPSEDSYLPEYFRATGFTCEYDICFDETPILISFEKKANAHAEIQQLNIKNIDNELLPVQIEIPVSIEETVCSAFRFTQPSMWRATPPTGYSDFSANTQIQLRISNDNTQETYLTEMVTIPIEADTCAGLAAFSWTPDAGLENESIKFRVDTDVIDNQVSSSLPDYAEVIETIYPATLDGACWVRAYDFTLSNTETFDLTTSIAQISEGETLYGGFRGGAYRDESITPMNFNADLYFNNQLVMSWTLQSDFNLQEYRADLSPFITNLPAGSYEVKLITTPVDNGCDIIEDVEQTQNLQILATETYSVNFFVRDSDSNVVDNANINLQLLSADDYYQTAPSYNQNLATNALGTVSFNDVIAGTYTYTVSKADYVTVSNTVHIASNSDIYITLPADNVAPLIDLPTELTEYYLNTVEVDLSNYVTDFNDLFTSLSLTSSVTSGTANAVIVNGYLYVSTSTPNDAVVQVRVEDPSGATAQDSITIHFVDNTAPVVNVFEAQPDNGDAPFATNFAIDVTDAEGDSLSCTLTFGDGTQTSDSCSNLNGVAHTYSNVGTYNAVLIVEDGTNEPVQVVEQVFVFEREYSSPHIGYFTLDSTNGNNIPTNLTLTWDVTHPDNFPMTCTLRVNGVSQAVGCANGVENIDNFNIAGNSRFTIIADDGEHQVLRSIDRYFVSVNEAPVVTLFNMTPTFGIENLTSTVQFSAQDPENDNLTCTIYYGDGQSTQDDCSNIDGLTHNYTIGFYNAFVRVTDGTNIVNSNLVPITVVTTADGPQIDYFIMSTATGDFTVPNNLTFEFSATHPLLTSMDCTLDINGNSSVVPCIGTFEVTNYDLTGTGVFVFTATDGTTNASETIEQLFVSQNDTNNTVDLTLDLVDIILDDVVTPGEVRFGITVMNETLNERVLEFRPRISCDGATARINLANDGTIPNGAISKVEREEGFVYWFDINTLDFTSTIPTDVNCRFVLNVQDAYGTDIDVTKSVMFSYPVAQRKIQSIRGQGTDILNYMSTALSQEIIPGYNTISFIIENNEEEAKEISITLMSTELKLNYHEEISIGADMEREVQVPIFIASGTKSGMYPARLSINDGDDKQTRYIYVKVE